MSDQSQEPVEVRKVVDLTEPDTIEGIVARQTEQIGRLVSVVEDVTTLLQRSEHNRARDRRVYVTLLVVLFIVVLGLGGLVLRFNSLSDSNHKVLTTIQDCTDPSGACAKRGAAQTGKAVQQLIDSEKQQHKALLQQIQQIEKDAISRFCVANPAQCAQVSHP